MNTQSEAPRIADFQRSREWRRDGGRALFGTDSSWEWFVRQHRAELVERGALILRAGPGGSLVNTKTVDEVVVDILKRESNEALGTTEGAA